jgi:hypothetical protein
VTEMVLKGVGYVFAKEERRLEGAGSNPGQRDPMSSLSPYDNLGQATRNAQVNSASYHSLDRK